MTFGLKNPHKTNIDLEKSDFVAETCPPKSLIYKGKTVFFAKPRFSKTFWLQKTQKSILHLICGNRWYIRLFSFCGHKKKCPVIKIVGVQGFFISKSHKKNVLLIKVTTEENFFDMFNRIHNPDYYYGRQKTEKKKTEKKKTTRRTYTTKRHPIFKVQD